MKKLKLKLENKVKQVIKKANKTFKIKIPNVQISYSDKLTKTYAYVKTEENSIKFSNVMLKEYKQKYINHIPVHEIGHIVTSILYPNVTRDHGKEWKYVMIKLDENFKYIKASFDL